jgi:hypothetical protein
MGPDPNGTPIQVNAGRVQCNSREELWQQHVEAGSRQEILKGEAPTRRYLVGVLYPDLKMPVEEDPDDNSPVFNGDATSAPEAPLGDSDAVAGGGVGPPAAEGEDVEVALANADKPRSLGVSFLAQLSPADSVTISFKGGRYRRVFPAVTGDPDASARWWKRSTIRLDVHLKASGLLESGRLSFGSNEHPATNLDGLRVSVELISRPHEGGDSSLRLITVSVVNRTETNPKGLDEASIFQSRISVKIGELGGASSIVPYPAIQSREDPEAASIDLLFRKQKTFATGHGCSADWRMGTEIDRAALVIGTPFPVHEVPNVTPEVVDSSGEPVEVAMGVLAEDQECKFPALDGLLDLYEDWLDEKKGEAKRLEKRHLDAAEKHLRQGSRCLSRARDGLGYLRSDKTAADAFRLMNQAMLFQQIETPVRRGVIDRDSRSLQFDRPFSDRTKAVLPDGRGNWRPFQIVFILSCLRSASNRSAPDPLSPELDTRNTVELLWFPTGGGKTEAYLGLIAFSLFMRRLRDPDDTGTHVLMRYTLRLLTSQQFERAAGLFCAMDHLRREVGERLGDSPFSIGMWLGGDTTPNSRQDALQSLRALRSARSSEEYRFALLKCPWCGAQMGLVGEGRLRQLLGVMQRGQGVVLHCPDRVCEFSEGLPVSVIDEEIYLSPPSMLVATIDKFATLAWKPEARSLFGIGPDGLRVCSPPGLIIQDELHLISGPLGSMTGLYEGAIEALCRDEQAGEVTLPKIISSTATARRYREQIRSLYSRTDAAVFPPPGLETGDSFFSRYAQDPDGTFSDGRMFVGIHASGASSQLATNVRVFSSLLHETAGWEESERDPWHSLMIFYNSLRELGGGLTLFQGDVPERMRALARRHGQKQTRYVDRVMELTGRLSSADVPKSLEDLGKTVAGGEAIDVCLASSMIEVGIDVDRLSLMCIAGQPKTTSQYIQVTGRVGRRWWERPALVVMIYSPRKPRDRSHFERFRSYHDRLYAQVEPVSATPYTPATLERGLHGVMAAYVRQSGTADEAATPTPIPRELLGRLKELLDQRVAVADDRELATLERIWSRKMSEWEAWNCDRWVPGGSDEDPSLLRYAGSHYPPEWTYRSWPTPTSMRNVDAECRPEVTQLYLAENTRDLADSDA